MKTVERYHRRDGRVVKLRYVWHEFTRWRALYPDRTGTDFTREWQVFEEYVGSADGERFVGRRSDPASPSQGFDTLVDALHSCADYWRDRLERARESMQEASVKLSQTIQKIEGLNQA